MLLTVTDFQECLGAQASGQQSLQQLQALGEQLKSQFGASSMTALQTHDLPLPHHQPAPDYALHWQREVLQVGWCTHPHTHRCTDAQTHTVPR